MAIMPTFSVRETKPNGTFDEPPAEAERHRFRQPQRVAVAGCTKDYVPHKTLYNRWKRWGEAGVFLPIMEGLAAADAEPKTVRIDATYLKAHRTESSLRVKGDSGGSSAAPKGE